MSDDFLSMDGKRLEIVSGLQKRLGKSEIAILKILSEK